mmetsp:Transcript_71275/g.130086  ORF Transcript_71275/g.130086 Transcript_71275/m.130086 type:complete len:338 (-) Transcript_71275:24-1037(-)
MTHRTVGAGASHLLHILWPASTPSGSRRTHGDMRCGLLSSSTISSKAARASSSQSNSCRRKAGLTKEVRVQRPQDGGGGSWLAATRSNRPAVGVRGTTWSAVAVEGDTRTLSADLALLRLRRACRPGRLFLSFTVARESDVGDPLTDNLNASRPVRLFLSLHVALASDIGDEETWRSKPGVRFLSIKVDRFSDDGVFKVGVLTVVPKVSHSCASSTSSHISRRAVSEPTASAARGDAKNCFSALNPRDDVGSEDKPSISAISPTKPRGLQPSHVSVVEGVDIMPPSGDLGHVSADPLSTSFIASVSPRLVAAASAAACPGGILASSSLLLFSSSKSC